MLVYFIYFWISLRIIHKNLVLKINIFVKSIQSSLSLKSKICLILYIDWIYNLTIIWFSNYFSFLYNNCFVWFTFFNSIKKVYLIQDSIGFNPYSLSVITVIIFAFDILNGFNICPEILYLIDFKISSKNTLNQNIFCVSNFKTNFIANSFFFSMNFLTLINKITVWLYLYYVLFFLVTYF